MPSRYYLPGDLHTAETERIRKGNCCAVCGEWLAVWWDGKSYLACHRHNRNHHEGIAREFKPPNQELTIAKEEIMSTEVIQTLGRDRLERRTLDAQLRGLPCAPP